MREFFPGNSGKSLFARVPFSFRLAAWRRADRVAKRGVRQSSLKRWAPSRSGRSFSVAARVHATFFSRGSAGHVGAGEMPDDQHQADPEDQQQSLPACHGSCHGQQPHQHSAAQ
jgi:hypothetical protein